MDFALDEVLLMAFRRFWACGPFGGKTKQNKTMGIEDRTGEVK